MKNKKGASYLKEAPCKSFRVPFAGIVQIRCYGYFSATSCEAPRIEKIFC